jgi:nitroreductase
MLEILKNRRSIRKYKDKKVEDEKIEQLIHAALLSPTSRNFYSWEFMVVNDKETIGELSKAKASGSAFLKDAPLAFVVLGDPQISDVWVEDASIASIIIQLTAQSLGLGSCWIQIRKRDHDDKITSEDYVKDLLGIPEGKRVESIISIGYPNEDRLAHKIEDLRFDKVCRLPSR